MTYGHSRSLLSLLWSRPLCRWEAHSTVELSCCRFLGKEESSEWRHKIYFLCASVMLVQTKMSLTMMGEKIERWLTDTSIGIYLLVLYACSNMNTLTCSYNISRTISTAVRVWATWKAWVEGRGPAAFFLPVCYDAYQCKQMCYEQWCSGLILIHVWINLPCFWFSSLPSPPSPSATITCRG